MGMLDGIFGVVMTKSIGQVLKMLRSEHSLSQEELAQKLKFNRTYVSLLESGKRTPSYGTLLKVASAFDIPTDRFMNLLEKRAVELGEVDGNQNRSWISTLRTADVGLWSLNIKTGDMYHNEWWKEKTGYSIGHESFNIGGFNNLIPPMERDFFNCALSDYIHGRKSYFEIDYAISVTGGGIKRFWSRGKAAENSPEGQPVILRGLHIDLTDSYMNQRNQRNQASTDTAFLFNDIEKAMTRLKNIKTNPDLVGEQLQFVEEQVAKIKMALIK